MNPEDLIGNVEEVMRDLGIEIPKIEEFEPETPDKHKKIKQQNTNITSTYEDVEFEEKAKYLDNNPTQKELFTYDKSDERIKRNNPLARHARPSEAFGLIIDCLENKVNDEKLLKVKEDMLESYGEWLSCAFERQGDTLIVYLDPTGINWNGSEYNKTENFTFSDKKEFNITGIDSQTWTDLNKFSDEFVKHLYGKTFNELPEEMKTGSKRAQVRLPSDRKLWPVGRGGCDGSYVVGAYFYYDVRASRGIVFVGAPTKRGRKK